MFFPKGEGKVGRKSYKDNASQRERRIGEGARF